MCYPGYHWKARTRPWVTYGVVIQEFGRCEVEARAAYRRFIRVGVADPPAPPRQDAVEDLILGSELFVQQIRKMFSDKRGNRSLPQLAKLRERPPLQEIVEAVAREFRLDEVVGSLGIGTSIDRER